MITPTMVCLTLGWGALAIAGTLLVLAAVGLVSITLRLVRVARARFGPRQR
jgi:hypothetical protein